MTGNTIAALLIAMLLFVAALRLMAPPQIDACGRVYVDHITVKGDRCP